MMRRRPARWWPLCWGIITPTVILGLLILTIVNHKPRLLRGIPVPRLGRRSRLVSRLPLPHPHPRPRRRRRRPRARPRTRRQAPPGPRAAPRLGPLQTRRSRRLPQVLRPGAQSTALRQGRRATGPGDGHSLTHPAKLRRPREARAGQRRQRNLPRGPRIVLLHYLPSLI